MTSEIDIMRILGNIEGKLDNLMDGHKTVHVRLDALNTELQAHKEDDARDKNRVIGVMTALGAILSTAWALITFFGTSIAKAFHQ